MEAPLRFCTIDLQQILEISEDIPINKVTNIKPSFEGGLAFAGNFLLDVIWSRPFNYTVIKADRFGSEGCEGSIARNETDVAVAIIDFPVNEDYEKVNPVFTLFEEPLVILQAYNRTDHRQKFADIVQLSLASFSFSLWLAILFLLLVIGIIMKISQKAVKPKQPKLTAFEMRRDWYMGRKRKVVQESFHPFFETFSCFMQKRERDFEDFPRRLLIFLVSLASLIIVSGYFCNLMSTEMVVVEKPVVITSYQGIIDRPYVTATFVQQLTDYEHFRDAPKGSKEYDLWRIMTTQRSTQSDILINPQGFETVIPKVMEGSAGLRILIISKLFEEAVRTTVCRLKYTVGVMPQGLTYSAIDPGSPSFAKGIIMRQAKIPILMTAAKRGRRLFEGGLTLKVKKDIGKGFLSEKLVDGNNPEDMRYCMSPTLVVGKPGYRPADLANYKFLGLLAAVLLLIAFVVLIIENICYYFRTRTRRARPLFWYLR